MLRIAAALRAVADRVDPPPPEPQVRRDGWRHMGVVHPQLPVQFCGHGLGHLWSHEDEPGVYLVAFPDERDTVPVEGVCEG